MSLRVRLILTHSLIVLIALTIVAASLIIILRGYARNTEISRLQFAVVPLAAQARAMFQSNVPPKEIVTRLEQQSGDIGQIMIINQKGLVLADPHNGLTDRVVPLDLPSRKTPEISGIFQLGPKEGNRTIVYAGIASGQLGGQTIFVVLTSGDRPIGRALADIIPSLLVAGGLTLAISLLIALLLARSISRPITRLTQATEAFAQGRYDHRVPAKGDDEIGRLAASFNSMAERVQRSRQMEKDFVANVSHELKTPLTSIQGFSQAILDGAVRDLDGARRAAQTIYDETARMGRLVGDLLTLARFESGETPLVKETLDLNQLLPRWVERFQPAAQSQGICLKALVNPLPPMMGDPGRLEQVVANLVENALKYNHSGGSVTVTGKAEAIYSPSKSSVLARRRAAEVLTGHTIEIAVADTGPGICAEDLPRLFNRFYRGDKARAAGGTGLGLSIAQEIVHAHGGQITVQSNVGQGTTFTVRLPARDGVRR